MHHAIRYNLSMQIRLSLFGRFRLEKDGQEIQLPTRKVEALLAYLALQPTNHSREQLAALFWGDVTDAKARASLRNALPRLRKVLGKTVVQTTHSTVQLTTDLWVDALVFRQQAETFLHTADPQTTPHELYQGHLLADFYDDWIAPERESLRQLYLEVLLKAAQLARSQARYAPAITLLQQLLQDEPTHEAAHQLLINCYYAAGNKEAALRQYESCCQLLWDELGVEPAPETVALYERILAATSQQPSPQAILGNLPIPYTTFIGRRAETTFIQNQLHHNRLLTLTGLGGSGKTRLAIEAATQVAQPPTLFPDGIWWVELAALSQPDFLPQTVLRVLGVAHAAVTDPQTLLYQHLATMRCLLILDNCEHLILACAQLSHDLLTHCPHLTILATSRERLGLSGESVYPVPPLAADNSIESEAVQLFVERAAAVSPSFRPTPHTLTTIADLCHQLDGLPLAIELAAARSAVLSPAEILARLDDRLALLTSGNRAAWPRQQTLRAALDWSYDLLAAEEQKLFHCLSVFAGTFSLEAVTAVYGKPALTSLELLAQLIAKSLVIAQPTQTDTRYYLLETVRQYAADRLWLSGDETSFRKQHLTWCVTLTERAEPHLLGTHQTEWLQRLEAEYANISVALAWASANGRFIDGLRVGGALWRFWDQRGYGQEGRQRLEQLLALTTDPSAIRAKALLSAGILAYLQTEPETAVARLNEALLIYQQTGDTFGIALCQHHLGFVAHRQAEYATARPYYEEALASWRKLKHEWGLAETLGVFGQLAYREGDYEAAKQWQRESLSIKQQLGDQRGTIFSLWCLGNVAQAEKDYAEAQKLYQEALTLAWEMADRWSIPYCLEGLGFGAITQARWLRGCRLLAAAEALREQTHSPLPAAWQASFKEAKTAAATHFAHAFPQKWQEGRELGLAAAVALALE